MWRTHAVTTIDLANSSVVVLGGTGALGRRISAVLADRGARVTVAGREKGKAAEIAESIGGVPTTVDFLDPGTLQAPPEPTATAATVLGIAAAITIVFGLVPWPLLDAVRLALPLPF